MLVFSGVGDLTPESSLGLVFVVVLVESLRVELVVGAIKCINEGNEGNSEEGNLGVGKFGG